MEFGKLGKGRNIYDIERRIKLKEAKLQFLFWGGVAVVILILLLLKYYLNIGLCYKKYDGSFDCQAERSRSLVITGLRLRSA
ncbi:hypothetical protein ACILDT_09390 [Capnocytophaga canis]|uniref:hypothetical protein n=1 Tax=Capnocytophaga canis TaxID=1848903 RepID=UPI0037D4B397